MDDNSLTKLSHKNFQEIGIWNKVFPSFLFRIHNKFKDLYLGFYHTFIWKHVMITNSESVKHWPCLRMARKNINGLVLNLAKCLNTQYILKSKFCDGMRHCHGDENNCQPICRNANILTQCKCSYWQYQCNDGCVA